MTNSAIHDELHTSYIKFFTHSSTKTEQTLK